MSPFNLLHRRNSTWGSFSPLGDGKIILNYFQKTLDKQIKKCYIIYVMRNKEKEMREERKYEDIEDMMSPETRKGTKAPEASTGKFEDIDDAMSPETIIMGYRVEKVDSSECQGFVAYRLHGKRGAVYSLVRNHYHPHQMFIVNRNMNVCSVKGNYWFSDESGELVAIS